MRTIFKSIFAITLTLLLLSCESSDVSYNDVNYEDGFYNKEDRETGIVERITQFPCKNSVYAENHNYQLILPFKAKKIDITQNPPLVSYEIIDNQAKYDYYNMGGAGFGLIDSVLTIAYQLPIKVKMRDYSVKDIVTLEDEQKLYEANQKYPITNIKFVYPVTINLINNAQSQKTFINNEQFFGYINTMSANESFRFSYPITLNKNDQNVVVNNNAELRSIFGGI